MRNERGGKRHSPVVLLLDSQQSAIVEPVSVVCAACPAKPARNYAVQAV